jgi:hypothetical protein
MKLNAYGRIVEICGPETVLDLARSRLPPTYRLTSSEPERTWAVEYDGGTWTVLAAGRERSAQDNEAAATEALLSDLELWVAENARRAVFIHAGCAVADGRAIVLPGYSYSGKTSLTAALVRAGADYYSDEFAVLDEGGSVHPYPRSLSIRGDGQRVERVSIDDLAGRAGRGPAHVGLIASLFYDPTIGFVVTRRTDSHAALLLLRHAVPARLRPAATLTAIQGAVADAAAVVGTRGEADGAAATLLEMLTSDP